MKYKVGDKVKIKSLDWYNENKSNFGAVYAGSGFCFWKNMARHCGEIMEITIVKVDPEDSNKGYYFMENSDERWTDGMIEGLVEEESANYSKVIDNGVSNPIIAKTSSATIDTDKGFYSYSDSDDNLEMERNLPEGYIFKDENGNVINATKIILEKKKKEYPKTYDKCCEVLGIGSYFEPEIRNATTEECHKFTKLIRLKRCRDAYWKLYGEEMGLGKPWEPDYNSLKTKYTIEVIENKVVVISTISENHILAFPTEEMRDTFYENFKEEIEICKELL